ncbi:MAG: RNA polymerase sigma factor [Vicinamibacterales bacterium]|nr:RNA polymerase sigma factor [Vicinamibacterales bacterium]
MDTTTFQELYDEHAADVHRFARYLTGSDDAAADITSEVFLRAWTGRDTLRAVTAKAYLLAIARNLARDRYRFSRRWLGAEMPDPAVGPDADARLELNRALDAARKLPEAYREPLLLVASGQTYEEAGRVLDLTVSTVKIRVHRARLMLVRSVPQH